MNRIDRLRTLHHTVVLLAGIYFGTGCFLIYGFDAEPPAACRDVSDCAQNGNGCGVIVCEQGGCLVRNPLAAGVVPLDEPRGDCRKSRCDGKGNRTSEVDATDVPVDGNPCTEDLCTNGKPMNALKAAGATCGTISSVTCNDLGECVNCMIPLDCGVDTSCQKWSCEMGKCVRNLTAPGTAIGNPVPGDCRKTICTNLGDFTEAFSPDDAPSDNNPCTTDLCSLQGDFNYPPASNGTPCGDCQVCQNGVCNACNSMVSDCYAGQCIPKPTPCTADSDCASTYCVDGFCCNSECASSCMACSNAKTGQPSGYCAPILNGTDPDSECKNTDADVCFNSSCRCENGVKDDDEAGVDCGGACPACTGAWNCGGLDACNGAVPGVCCPVGCFDCTNSTTTCKSLQGQSCALGSTPIVLTLGTVNQPSCIFPGQACKSTTCKCE